MTWDAEGKLQAANGETYLYDDQGRRVRKTVGATTTNYLYNGPDIHAETSATNAIQAVYAHGPNWDDPLIRLTGSTNQPAANAAYYHQDGLNSSVAATDNLGTTTGTQRFDAWGNKVASTGTVPQFGYTGREPDATGLAFYRARYYDPSIGRFISKDPAGMPDGVNRFAYVGNDPVNNVDPEGKEISVARSGSNVNINFSVVYYGPGASLEVQRRWDQAIANAWSGSFGGGQYNVTTKVTSKVITGNTAPSKPSGAVSDFHAVYVPAGSGQASAYAGGTTGRWPASSEGWVAAHEFGHFLGLNDQYRNDLGASPYSTSLEGWERNIMGAGGKGSVVEAINFEDIFINKRSINQPTPAYQPIGGVLGETNYYGGFQGTGGPGQQTVKGVSP